MQNIGILLDKLQKMYAQFTQSEHLSALEKDTLLHNIRLLYEACLDLETRPTPAIEEKPETPVVAEPQPQKEEPKLPEKKASFVFTHIAEEVEKEQKTAVEEVKKQEPEVLVIRTEVPPVEEKKVVEQPPVVVEEIKKQEPIVEPLPPPVEEKKMVEQPPVVVEEIKKQEPIVEPLPPPVEEKKAVEQPPVMKQEPEIMVIRTEIPPKEEEKPAATAFNADYDELFTFKIATDLSQKLSERPIADLDTAIAIGDKFMYMNQLFGGDAGAFKACREGLQLCKNIDEARTLLESEFITRFKWIESNRKQVAKEFVKLARRLYLK